MFRCPSGALGGRNREDGSLRFASKCIPYCAVLNIMWISGPDQHCLWSPSEEKDELIPAVLKLVISMPPQLEDSQHWNLSKAQLILYDGIVSVRFSQRDMYTHHSSKRWRYTKTKILAKNANTVQLLERNEEDKMHMKIRSIRSHCSNEHSWYPESRGGETFPNSLHK